MNRRHDQAFTRHDRIFATAPFNEFVFRFNRRKTRPAAFRSLLGIAVARKPTTYKMLIAPEAMV